MSLSSRRLEKVRDIGKDATASMWSYMIPYGNWYVEDCTKHGKQEKSPKIEVGDAGFRILVQQVQEDIGIYVECTGPLQRLNNSNSWDGEEVVAHIKIETIPVSGTPNEDQINTIIGHTFSQNAKSIGFSSQVTKQEFPEVVRNTTFSDGFTTGIQIRFTIKNDTMSSQLATSIRKKHSYVGLRNQGATCYVNSLIQVLYHLGGFRQVTYLLAIELSKVSTPGKKIDRKKEIVMSLANLFYDMQKLQVSNEPGVKSITTTKLTDSFGWGGNEVALEQQDVQELARILIDAIEFKITKTPLQNKIKDLLAGKIHHFIKCTKVDFGSSSLEPFLDLQLCVRGCSNIKESFKKQLQSEMLTGDNAYHAVDPSKNIDSFEDAKKGMEYTVFPPVLCLHLRRCEFDYVAGENKMVNDRFEFPIKLDISEYYRTEERTKKGKQDNLQYELFSVLAHSGTGVGGHYFTYVRPHLGDKHSPDRNQWFKFDDSSVTSVSERSATNELFGGASEEYFWLSDLSTGSSTVAYMLTYVRSSKLSNIAPSEVPLTDELHRVFERRNRAQREALTKKLVDRQTYEFHISSEDVLSEYDVSSGYLHRDLLPPGWSSLAPLKISMQTTYEKFIQQVHKHFSVPLNVPIRLWIWLERNNETIRAMSPLITLNTAVGDKCSIPQPHTPLSDMFITSESDGPHKVMLHIDQGDNLKNGFIGIFIKQYDPVLVKLTFAGTVVVSCKATVSELSDKILKLKDLPIQRTRIRLWEECRASLIQPLHSSTSSLFDCGIGTGDIVIFTTEMDLARRVSNPPSPADAFKSLLTKRLVTLVPSGKVVDKSSNQPPQQEIKISLFITDRYSKVLGAVSEAIRVSGRHIRFSVFGKIISPPFEYISLSQMLTPDNRLTYETTTIAIPTLLSKLEVPVSYVTLKGVVKQDAIFLKNDAMASAALAAISGLANSNDMAKRSAPPLAGIVSPKKLQLVQVVNCRINCLILPNYKLRRLIGPETTFQASDNVGSFSTWDTIPRESSLISICHCERQWTNSHILEIFATPFLFVVSPADTGKSFITTVAKQMGITKEARINAWKLILIHLEGRREVPIGNIPLTGDTSMLTAIANLIEEHPILAHIPLDVRNQKPQISLMIGIERRNEGRKTVGEKGVEIKE